MAEAEASSAYENGRLQFSQIHEIDLRAIAILFTDAAINNRIIPKSRPRMRPQIDIPVNPRPFESLKIENRNKRDTISLVLKLRLWRDDGNASDDEEVLLES